MSEQAESRGRTHRLALLYAVAACLVGVAVAMRAGERPDVAALITFTVLVVVAENLGVVLPSEVGVSPAFMVVMAAIAAFHSAPVLGACVVGASAGLSIQVFRQRRYATLVINIAQYLLAAAAASVTYEGLASVPTLGRVLVTGVVFGAVNVALILPAVVLEYDERPAAVWADMRPALPNYLAFGLVGTLIGSLYSSLGAIAVVLLLTPVVIARATFWSFLQLVEAHEATIRVFLRAIEAKDTYTARHTQRVCKYSLYIGEQMGFSHDRLAHLRRAALMHDIGKLAVPKHLLNKPGKLTDDEFARVQRHAHVCVEILDIVDFLKPMTAAAAGHHARYDGGGYGGTGERPLEAYIVAVADAFDAMTSTRSYRKALAMEVAFEELLAKSGSQFHPDCVAALIGALTARGERVGLGFEEDAVAFEVEPPVAGVGSAGLGDRLPDVPPAPSRSAPVAS
ncbi:MAG TPA: HD domain-containing phosphohydrolase [Acidimicrobiales bacterium]|nr:HD domain-containing phosphohydrolase [Acidimicrobiales bacterium]